MFNSFPINTQVVQLSFMIENYHKICKNGVLDKRLNIVCMINLIIT